jgi:hypothetical protein
MRIAGSLLIVLSMGAAWARQDAPVSGQYMEDRTMRVYACPCEWSTDWAHRGREAVLAWNIQSGEFDGTPLAGLRLTAVLVGDFTLTEADSPRRSALYVDAAAPGAQRDAGLRWLRSQYAGLLGQVVAVHALPIALSFDPERITLEVGSILSLRMRRTRLADEAQSWAERIHEPFVKLSSWDLATTSHISYAGSELKIRWTREENAITGYFGTFAALTLSTQFHEHGRKIRTVCLSPPPGFHQTEAG